MKRTVVLLILAACGGGDPCKDAVANMVDSSMNDGSERKTVGKEQMAKAKEAVTGALAEVCRHDKWSAETTDCLKAATDFKSAHACEQKMTEGQQHAASKAIETALQGLPRPK
jgi:hypothetical protein